MNRDEALENVIIKIDQFLFNENDATHTALVCAMQKLQKLSKSPVKTKELRIDVFLDRNGNLTAREHGHMILPHPQHIAIVKSYIPESMIHEVTGKVEYD